ncbi:MAG: hypothetical protein V7K38_11345 [Nostoc sp.]|uniref:hypothetical protein n=1 Tax=Nostoc sp. TaxID=1180 RepID=UPI002FF56F25
MRSTRNTSVCPSEQRHTLGCQGSKYYAMQVQWQTYKALVETGEREGYIIDKMGRFISELLYDSRA